MNYEFQSALATSFTPSPVNSLYAVGVPDVYTVSDISPLSDPSVKNEELARDTDVSTSQKSSMKKVKEFISTKPMYALLIIVALGFIIGGVIPKLFGKKKITYGRR